MRLEIYLKEWKIERQYAGRGILKSTKSDKIIVWYYMKSPSFKGLIWTTADGTTYLNDKKITKINYPIHKMTHKKQLAELYDELDIEKYMDGEKRDNIERLNEANPRGRIIDNTIYVYEFNNKRMIDKAIDAIYRYIPEE